MRSPSYLVISNETSIVTSLFPRAVFSVPTSLLLHFTKLLFFGAQILCQCSLDRLHSTVIRSHHLPASQSRRCAGHCGLEFHLLPRANFLVLHFIYFTYFHAHLRSASAGIASFRGVSICFRSSFQVSTVRYLQSSTSNYFLMEPSQRVVTRVAVLKLILLGPVLGMLLCCENACTVTAASTKEEFEISGAAGKYNNHAPVISHQGQSQMHQDVVRALRIGTKYSTFAALLDNMTESVIRPGITVFAPCNEALSDFQKTKAEERLQDVIRFHIITVPMRFSNLLRLEVGSRLTTDVSNRTIQVTNVTASAYEVDDAVIVDPDLYTDATIAVHGINAVFNTSKFSEVEPIEVPPIIEEPPTVFNIPHPFGTPVSDAFKIPSQAKDVSVYQILMSFSVLFLLKLTL